jgi:HD superfamily phosphodiesterase
VSNLFQSHEDKRLVYHNLDHTAQVVENAVKIGNHYQLSDDDFFIVIAACWFHDIGYFYDCNQHESKGISLAADFLKEKGINQEIIDKVGGCIRALKAFYSKLFATQTFFIWVVIVLRSGTS